MQAPPERPELPNVARASGIMVLSLFLSRVLGIIREMIMAGKFGQDANTDAYFLAFQIPDLLFFLIAGGALSTAFIPVFSEYLHTGREKQAWKLFSVVVTLMSIVVIAFIVFAWIFAEPLARLVAPHAPAESIPLVAEMSRVVLPAQYAFFIGGIMFGTLYARQRFVAPGLGPNIYNLGIIFGALVLSAFFTPGVKGMSWGALIGAVTGNLLVPFLVMRQLGADFKPSLDLSDPGVKKVFKLMLPVVLGLSLPAVYAIIMRAMGTEFGTGIVSGLDYSNKLMQAPLGVFGQSLALAVFPALTQFFAQERMDLFRDQLQKTLRTVLYITLPISAIMFALAPEIVTAAFEHGRFSQADSEVTANALRMFSIGVWAWCLHPVLMRGYFALQRTVTPIVIGTATTGVFIVSVLLLKGTSLQYAALPLGSSIAAIVLAIGLLGAIVKPTGGLQVRGVVLTFLKAGSAAIAAGLLAYLGALAIPAGEGGVRKILSLIVVLGPGVAAAWAYYFLTKWMSLPETEYLDRAFRRLRRSPAAKVQSDESEIGG